MTGIGTIPFSSTGIARPLAHDHEEHAAAAGPNSGM
jgi:hypothetical protein